MEKGRQVYLTFVDIQKAYDTVSTMRKNDISNLYIFYKCCQGFVYQYTHTFGAVINEGLESRGLGDEVPDNKRAKTRMYSCSTSMHSLSREQENVLKSWKKTTQRYRFAFGG